VEIRQAFKKTPKKTEAIKLLASGSRNVMLYGGSRSGKSFIALYAMFVRAGKIKSRHICLRLRFNHVKTSLWMDTAKKVYALCFPDCGAVFNNSDFYISFPNGSEIWFGGLDDKNRTEKILGKENSTIFFNECSQLGLKEINIAKTRLAEKNALRKLIIYDQNPPSRKHWAFSVFENRFDPLAECDVPEDDYQSILMNPEDNIENIDGDYLDMLSKLPPRERDRFLKGVYAEDEEGLIYHAFKRELHVKPVTYDPNFPIWSGHDFNVNPMTAVIGQVINGTYYIFDELCLKNSNTPKMCKAFREKYKGSVFAVPDSTGRKQTTNANRSDIQIMSDYFTIKTANNPFRVDRYAAVNGAIALGRLVIDPSCKHTIKDLEQLSYIEGTDKPDVSQNIGHISDAMGYVVYKTVNPLRSNQNLVIGQF
jgi:phage terminase large subunit